MRKIVLLLSALVIGIAAQAQVTLTGTSYTQNFDNIGTGLPLGWEVDSVATPTTKGFAMAFDTTRVAWNNTAGKAKNLAAKGSFAWNEATANQIAATNRALGIRQTTPLDSQVAFTLQINSTTGFSNFSLSFKLMSLDSTSPRITTWKVQYATGATPTNFADVTATGTLTTGGNTFAENQITASFGSLLNNLAGPVWIRIVAPNKTTGTNNRASTAIDDFVLSYNSGSGPVSYRPNITALVPSNNATNVAANANLQITFDRQITGRAAGSIRIKNVTDQTTVTKAGNSTDVTISGNVVTIANTGLALGKSYYVTFDSTAFDTAGYKSYGIYDSTAWRFSVPMPNFRPTITPVYPTDNATSLPANNAATLILRFSRRVTKGTSGNITIKNETDQTTVTKAAASGDVTLNAAGDTAYISNVQLVAGKAYHVLVDSVAFDTAGYKVVGITDTTRWNFSTQGPIITVTALNEQFEGSCPAGLPAGWLQYSVTGSATWRCNTAAANYGLSMNGGGATSSTANEDWLITPRLNLAGQGNPMLAFRAKYRFAGPDLEVKYSTDYTGTGDPNAATWTNIPGIAFSTADSNVFGTKMASLNAAQLFVAFKYTSTTATPSNGREWTVDSVIVSNVPTGIRTVNSNNSSLPVQVLSPATNGHVVLVFDVQGPAGMQAAIYDLAGREVYRAQFRSVKGRNEVVLAPQALQSGMYVIRLTDGTQQGIARTFIH